LAVVVVVAHRQVLLDLQAVRQDTLTVTQMMVTTHLAKRTYLLQTQQGQEVLLAARGQVALVGQKQLPSRVLTTTNQVLIIVVQVVMAVIGVQVEIAVAVAVTQQTPLFTTTAHLHTVAVPAVPAVLLYLGILM
jgi:hypothetical protein